MKHFKLLALILVLITVASLMMACGEDEPSVICGNCAATVSNDSQYCSNCGAELFKNTVKQEETTGATDTTDTSDSNTQTDDVTDSHDESETTSTEVTETEPPETKPAETTSAPVTHKHSYSSATCTKAPTCDCGKTSGDALGHKWSSATCTSAKKCSRCGKTDGKALGHDWSEATCTEAQKCSRCEATNGSPLGHSCTATVTPPTCTNQGYTTYTCHCGYTYKADYTDASHNYQNYICMACDKIDKTRAYEYLIEYVETHGQPNGTFVSIIMREIDGHKYELKYDAQNKTLWATCWQINESSAISTSLLLEAGFYGIDYTHLESGAGSQLTGFIDPETFNENSAMTYESYTGLESAKISLLNFARSSLALTIIEIERYLDTNNVELNVYALGYMGMQ